EYLDEYVQRAVVAWLSRDDLYELLSAQTGGDGEVARARAGASRLRSELEEYKKRAETGDIKAHEYARVARGLEARIAECEERATDAGIPPVLRGRIGKQAPQ